MNDFPVMYDRNRDTKPGPLRIPRSVAEKAYSVYSARYGCSQSLDRLAERGGWWASELDELHPSWREESSEIATLARRLTELERERDQWRRDFDLAVRESLRRGEERDTLRADLAHARAEVERLRAVVEAARGMRAGVDRMRHSGSTFTLDTHVMNFDAALATLDGAGEGEG